MTMDFSGNPILPYVAGLSCFLLSFFMTYRRATVRPMKRFDIVEHGIVPAIILLILLIASSYVDLESDLSLGITLFLIFILGLISVPMGPIGWVVWLALLFLFLTQGNSILVVIGSACMAMLAGTSIGFAFAFRKERERRNRSAKMQS
jgi:hypothetical protein